MAENFIPTQTGFVRTFAIKRGARADRAPDYHNCMRPGAIEQAYGDITKVECPDPHRADAFIEVGRIKGAEERPTTQLIGRYPANTASVLKELADLRCDSDFHLNIGTCKDPSIFNQFLKKIIFEDGPITNYATDELGALGSDERAVVNETADLSGKRWYEVLPLNLASRAGSIVSNEIIDAVICDTANCGDCDDPSGGCEKIFLLSRAAGGSPSTPADIVFSRDKGLTWRAVDVDTLGAAEQPSALACIGDYLVVVSNDSNSLHYALKSEFDSTPDPTWTEVSTGFVSGGEPNDIWSVGSTAFICGDGGYLYKCTDPTAGVVVLDAGVAVQDDLKAIHAVSEDFFVAAGNAGAIVKSENGSTVEEVTPSPVGVGVNLLAIWIKENDNDQWFFGGSDGTLRYTIDGGVSFGAGSFSGSGSGNIRAIEFPSKSVGYLSHSTSADVGRLFRTYDGGKSWVMMPEKGGTLTANDRLTALATCPDDVNFVVAGGLADNGADGIVLVGED